MNKILVALSALTASVFAGAPTTVVAPIFDTTVIVATMTSALSVMILVFIYRKVYGTVTKS
jgi:hypothetical protein